VDSEFERIEIAINSSSEQRVAVIHAENKLNFLTEVRMLLLWLVELIK
jgi:hypothetical protein